MYLSIIIPTLNEKSYLFLLLDSIKTQNFFADYEMIIADAGSTDGTVEIAKNYGCRITGGGLPARGRNEGAKAAKGDLFLFIDGDTILPENFLQKSISEFNQRELDVASFFLYPYQKNKIFNLAYNVFYNWWPARAGEKVLPHASNAILVKKGLHQKLGGFDESIKIAEDHFYVRERAKIGKFGLIKSSNIFSSTRRFDKDGWAISILKFIWCEFWMIFFGPVRSDIFNYKFGFCYQNQKNSWARKVLNFPARILKELIALVGVIISWPLVSLVSFIGVYAKIIIRKKSKIPARGGSAFGGKKRGYKIFKLWVYTICQHLNTLKRRKKFPD